MQTLDNDEINMLCWASKQDWSLVKIGSAPLFNSFFVVHGIFENLNALGLVSHYHLHASKTGVEIVTVEITFRGLWYVWNRP